MGFDVYGLKPKENIKKPEILDKDWQSLSDEEQDLYIEANEKHHKDNPGVYFQCNVWYWRPLWTYICRECNDVMTEEDRDAGLTNDGYEISADTVDKMVGKLLVEMASGKHKEYETNRALYLQSLPLRECEFCNGKGKRGIIFKKECNVCDGEGKLESFHCNYPFDHEALEEFVSFLSESGGIQIC